MYKKRQGKKLHSAKKQNNEQNKTRIKHRHWDYQIEDLE